MSSSSRENGGSQEKERQQRIDMESGDAITSSRWASAIETFSPIWFTLSMNTGILSILYHQLPYGSRWLRICATIMFVFNIVLFTIFFLVHLVRLIRYPRSWKRQTSDAEEACFWACAPIALLTITTQIGLTASQANWGGHAFTLVAYVFWWFNSTWMLATGPVVYIFLIKNVKFGKGPISPAIVLAAVGVATATLVGGTIVNYSTDVSARLAVPVLIWSYILVGIAAWVGLVGYALTFGSLFTYGLPPGPKLPALFLLIGPAGQTASALQILGMGAMKDFGGYNKGTFLTMMAGSSVSAASIFIAMTFIGLDIFLFIIVMYIIIEGAFKRQLSFSLTWWSTIFPCATLALALLELSVSMNSPTFRVLCTIMVILLTVDYFVCWIFTILHIWSRKLLDGRQQLKEMEKQRLEEERSEKHD